MPFNRPALQIIPFLGRFAHRERLSGQNAARGNRREERALIHRAEQRRRRAVLGKARRILVAVDIIQRPAALFIAGKAPDLAEGIKLAGELIDSGAALQKLNDFIKESNQ